MGPVYLQLWEAEELAELLHQVSAVLRRQRADLTRRAEEWCGEIRARMREERKGTVRIRSLSPDSGFERGISGR